MLLKYVERGLLKVLYVEDVEGLRSCHMEIVYSLVLHRFSLLLRNKKKKNKSPVELRVAYFLCVVVFEVVERLYSRRTLRMHKMLLKKTCKFGRLTFQLTVQGISLLFVIIVQLFPKSRICFWFWAGYRKGLSWIRFFQRSDPDPIKIDRIIHYTFCLVPLHKK
jgi:hypothetical protein